MNERKNKIISKVIMTMLGYGIFIISGISSIVLFIMKIADKTEIDWFSFSPVDSVFSPVIYGLIIFLIALFNMLKEKYDEYISKKSDIDGKVSEMMKNYKENQ